MIPLFPEILHTPRLSLMQFSPDSQSDIDYTTAIFSQVSSVSDFNDFCIERAPIPWASHAILYLLRLRRRDSNDDTDLHPVQVRRTSEDVDGIYDKVIGHVSVAHSLRDRQPRITSAETSSSNDGTSGNVTDTENFASVALQTSTIPDIGWRIQGIHQRFGYATEAAERLVQFLCANEEGPRFRTLCCFAGETNAASRGVARKVGFVDVGVDFGSGSGTTEDDEQEEGSSQLSKKGALHVDAVDGIGSDDVCSNDGKSSRKMKKKEEDLLVRTNDKAGDTVHTQSDTGKVLTCPSVARGIWFGILGDGWTWREGRPQNTALEKSVAKLFESMALGSGVNVQQHGHEHVHENENASE